MLSNIKRAIKNSAIYGLGNVSTKIVGLILLPSFLGIFSTEDYGIYGMMEVSSTILIALLNVGLNTALVRFYWDKEYETEKKSLVFTIFIFLIAINILAYFAISGNARHIALLLFDNPERYYLVHLLALTSSAQILMLVPITLLRLQEKPVIYSSVILIKLTLVLGLTIYFVLYKDRNVEGIYEAQLIGTLSALVLLSRFIIKNIQLKFNFQILKPLLIYSFPLIFSSISGIMLSVTDRFVLKELNGLSDVGKYSFGFKIANTIKVFIVASLQMALTPMIYKMMYEDNCKRFYSKIMTYSSFGLMFFVLALSLFSYEVLQLLIKNFAKDPTFIEGYKVVPIVAFSSLVSMLINTSLIGLQIAKKTKIIATTIISVSVFNLILNLLLIPLLGIYGAAFSNLISQFAYWGIIYNRAQKFYYIPFELKKVILLLFVGGVISLSPLVLNHFSFLISVPVKIGLMLSFPVILYYLNFYEPVELLRLKQIWHTWKNPLLWKANFSRINKSENETE